MSCTLINADCLKVLPKLEEASIDLTVTSPPYDKLRSYSDSLEWNEDIWKSVIQELYRVTKNSGVVVWIVGDSTIKGSETGTSFKQALYFKEVGFNLHDTMIYAKKNYIPLTHSRYEQQFEYMFVLVKGILKTFNPIRIPTEKFGSWNTKRGLSKESGSAIRPRTAGDSVEVRRDKIKPNIWTYNISQTGYKHPAIFPEKLARDHISSWSNEGDLILDPFMGSGTTGDMALLMGRSFIGIEKQKEYFGICKRRLKDESRADLLEAWDLKEKEGLFKLTSKG